MMPVLDLLGFKWDTGDFPVHLLTIAGMFYHQAWERPSQHNSFLLTTQSDKTWTEAKYMTLGLQIFLIVFLDMIIPDTFF